MATRPTNDLLVWANTDVNLPNLAGPNKTEPSADLVAKGWDFKQKPSADEFNYILNNLGEWVEYLKTVVIEATPEATANTLALRDTDGSFKVKQLTSTAPNGITPLIVTSTTKVDNLNADLLDGLDSTYYSRAAISEFTGGDWNTLITHGCYKIQHANFASDTNAPPASYAFGVLVVSVADFGDERRTNQIYYPHSTGDSYIYQRMFNSGIGWTGWSKIWRGGYGSGGGLDADLLDGMNPTSTQVPNTVCSRDGNGDVAARYFVGGLSGNADTTTKWKTARTLTATGFATGTATGIDGSGDISLALSMGSGFTNSKTTSGYTYIPNGFIFQWGVFSLEAAASASQTITLPVSFPTACVFSGASPSFSGGGATEQIGATGSTTTITLTKGTADYYTRTGTWFALGF